MSDVIVPVWTLGDRLAKARKLVGLTPAGMAVRIGVTDKTIRNWESGATPIPRGQVIAYASQRYVRWHPDGHDVVAGLHDGAA